MNSYQRGFYDGNLKLDDTSKYSSTQRETELTEELVSSSNIPVCMILILDGCFSTHYTFAAWAIDWMRSVRLSSFVLDPAFLCGLRFGKPAALHKHEDAGTHGSQFVERQQVNGRLALSLAPNSH